MLIPWYFDLYYVHWSVDIRISLVEVNQANQSFVVYPLPVENIGELVRECEREDDDNVSHQAKTAHSNLESTRVRFIKLFFGFRLYPVDTVVQLGPHRFIKCGPVPNRSFWISFLTLFGSYEVYKTTYIRAKFLDQVDQLGPPLDQIKQGWGSGFGQKPDPGIYTSNEGRFFKVYKKIYLDNLKNLFFVFILLVSGVLYIS